METIQFPDYLLSDDLDSDNTLARNSARLTIKMYIAGMKDGGFVSVGDQIELSGVPEKYQQTITRLIAGTGLIPVIKSKRVFVEPEDVSSELDALYNARNLFL